MISKRTESATAHRKSAWFRTVKKIYVVLSALLLLLTVLFLWTLYDALTGICEFEVLQRTPSPDNTMEMIVDVGDCGVFTGEIHRVYVVRKGKDYDLDDIVFLMELGKFISADWISSDRILINYENDGSIKSFRHKNWNSSRHPEITYGVNPTPHYTHVYTPPKERIIRVEVR